MSRARDKITKAVEAKGWQVETLIWEGLGPHVEKSGQEGGWFLEIMPNPEYEQNVPAFFTSYDNSGINVAAVLEMLNYVPDIKSG